MGRFFHWIVRLLIASALAVGLGYLPYKAYGPDGVPRILRLEKQLAQLDEKNEQLRRDNHQLQVLVKSLKDDPAAVERVARDELGMARPEDIIFLFE